MYFYRYKLLQIFVLLKMLKHLFYSNSLMKSLVYIALWLLPLSLIQAQNCLDTVKLSMTYTITSGQQLEVSVRVQNFTNINAFQFAVEYDDNWVTFLSATSPLSGFNDQNYQLLDGHIRFLYDSSFMNSLDDGEELIKMVFNMDKISTSLNLAISDWALLAEFVNDMQQVLCYEDTPLTIPPQGQKLGGLVTYDANGNCQRDNAEIGLEGWLVELTYRNRKYYRTTDATGYFEFFVPEGVYSVRIIPKSEIWGACEDIIRTTVDQQGAPMMQFHVSRYIDCSRIMVNLSSSRLTTCSENEYTLVVQNQGTVAVTDVQVELEFDSFLTFVSSDRNIMEVEPQRIRVETGTLDVYEKDTIRLSFFLSCEAEVGQTHCITAMAAQNNPCFVPSSWSGADLKITSECDRNSGKARFTVTNSGLGNMTETRRYIVTEDEVIRTADDIILDAQSLIDIELPANGATYRLFVPQTTGYPYVSQTATLALEGCTADNGDEFSLGFVTIFEESDRDVFIDKLCLESADFQNESAFISALPRGYGVRRYIDNGTQIEYLIEFSNNTNTILEDVMLKTYLTEDFDVTSLQMGAASHPFTYAFNADRELIIHFSSADMWPDEKGYIKFSIYPRAGLQEETRITVNTRVFYNFKTISEAVSTFHTIGQNYIVISSVEWGGEEWDISCYPNPTQDMIYLDLSSLDFKEGYFQMCDVHGKAVQTGSLTPGINQIPMDLLPSGSYLARIICDNQTLVTYKMIKY